MSQDEMESAKWTHVGGCFWLCVDTGKYHFACETEMLDETPYDTLDACYAALKAYAVQL